MNAFRVGDTVERKNGGLTNGNTFKITSISGCGYWIRVDGHKVGEPWKLFKLVDTSKHHKHHDLIIAWAKGAEIEVRSSDGSTWYNVYDKFNPDYIYRIKPAEPTELEKLIKEHKAMGETIAKLTKETLEKQ